MARTDQFDIFTLARYRITFTVVGQGTASCSPTNCCQTQGCNRNTPVTITATPAAGWVFDAWSGDVVSPDSQYTFPITQNMSITATFTQQQVLSEINTTQTTHYPNDPVTGEAWLPGQENAHIADLGITNIGSIPGVLSWRCYAHPNQTNESLLMEGSTPSVEPGATVIAPVSITIPNEEGATVPIGLMVKGESEEWPTWVLGLRNGKALIFGKTGLIDTNTLILAGLGVLGLVAVLWYLKKR